MSKTFQIINFPIAKPNIINIITSKVETTPFLQNLKILGITAAFWNIHILTLNERNTKKIMSFQEILNRIKASIIDLVYSFSHTHNWPRKSHAEIKGFISHLARTSTTNVDSITCFTLRTNPSLDLPLSHQNLRYPIPLSQRTNLPPAYTIEGFT